jgi:hypothetical protein
VPKNTKPVMEQPQAPGSLLFVFWNISDHFLFVFVSKPSPAYVMPSHMCRLVSLHTNNCQFALFHNMCN